MAELLASYGIDRLIHSAEFLRTLFEDNPLPMGLAEPSTGRITALNKAALALYWIKPERTAKLYLGSLKASDPQEQKLLGYPIMMGYRPPEDCQLELHRRMDGALLYVEVSCTTIELDQGSLWLAMFTDVSSRIATLRKARSSEQAYLSLLNDMRDAVLVVDKRQRIYYANPAANRLLGDEQDSLERLGLRLPPDADTEPLVTQVTTVQGARLWFEIQVNPTDWQGQPRSLLTLRDVTRRRQSEERLHLLQRSIEASSNGILITEGPESDYSLIYANPAFERITGYDLNEALGRNCRFLQGPDSEAERCTDIRQALQAREEISLVLRNYRKDGTPFWNDLYIAPVPDESGVINHFVGIVNDISEHRQAQSEIAFNASHDVLTGLPNRSLLEDRLEQALRLVERHECSLAVLLINLDEFKPVNDSLGHPTGDQVLISVAERLQSLVRPGDTVARPGSDEFIVLLPDLANPDDVVKVVEKVLKALSCPYHIQEHTLHITASIGIAVSKSRLDNAMELVQQADMAMTQAKQSGRNTYHWYTSQLSQEANNRVELRNNLEQAINANHLQLYFQPMVSCQTGTYIGSEALIRWVDPERGMILPTEFIPVAEETGQIVRLGQWVLERACTDNQGLIEAGFKDHTVSVNISPIQLQQATFISVVRNALATSGLPPRNLDLEVTESVLLGNSDQVIATLEELRAMGVGIVIDDFGKGFSSLNYIKKLPATKLKIDRHFIRDVIRDRKDASITQGIISMAHHLGLTVVVVGVETEAHAAFLKRSRCDILQGRFFSHPVPLADLKAVLNSGPVALSSPDDEHSRQTLLILDDEQNIIRSLTRLLRRDGYRILSTTDAQEAFQLLAENNVQVVISDQRMPEISGTEFLSQVKDIYPDTIRIVLSGYTDLKSITEAINQGAIYKFLTKPWEDDQLRQHIRQAFLHQAAGQPTGASLSDEGDTVRGREP